MTLVTFGTDRRHGIRQEITIKGETFHYPSSMEPPPAFEPLNIVDLVSVNDSTIVNVSVYSGRAEITRLFRFTAKTGQNQINIRGLPVVLDQQSLR